MRGVRWPVMLVALAALAAGCTSDEHRSRSEQRQPGAPTEAPPSAANEPISTAKLAKLAAFLDEAKPIHHVGAKFELRDVQYTSPTDAAAAFEGPKSRDRVIATTDDNWAHASGLSISWDLADLVDYLPLGRGAVAIKARSQFGGRSSPPFVLYPSGDVKPLRVTEPRALDADSELLKIDLFAFLYEIGAEEESDGQWAADVEAAEIFPLAGSPSGHAGSPSGGSPPDHLWQHVPGRDGALVSVAGYQRNVGDGVWRFETSTDTGHSWRRTDVRLPLGRKPIRCDYGVSTHAVGPEHLQAIAMVDWGSDAPLSLRELWRTDDEKEFRRFHLPWERMFFGGMAFAADGALLLAEVEVPARTASPSPATPYRAESGVGARGSPTEGPVRRPTTVRPVLGGGHRTLWGSDRRAHRSTDHRRFQRRLHLDQGHPRVIRRVRCHRAASGSR